jgi:hypothetical protein
MRLVVSVVITLHPFVEVFLSAMLLLAFFIFQVGSESVSLLLSPGEEVTIVAVGSGYTSWEGGRDPDTGKVTIGLSYDKLCRDVKPGGRILLADGSCCIQVGGQEGRGDGEV